MPNNKPTSWFAGPLILVVLGLMMFTAHSLAQNATDDTTATPTEKQVVTADASEEETTTWGWVIGLLLLAYAFVFFEALVPGGVLGLLGFACLVGASVAAQKAFGGWFAPAITFLLGGGGAIILVFLELRWLEGSRVGKPFFLGKAVTGTSNTAVAPDDVVGKEGEAATPLKPEGIIAIGDDRYDAFCEDGYVKRGTALLVSGKDGFRLLVRKR